MSSPQILPVHTNGDDVSTATRFSDRKDFKNAVRGEFEHRGLPNPWLITQKSYSFPELGPNPTKEILIVWQPGTTLPTQAPGQAGLEIVYKYSDAASQNSFERVVDGKCVPGSGRTKIEDSNHSPNGHQDGSNTYRAVVKVENAFTVTYEGWMTNPPYPARSIFKSEGGYFKLAVAAAAGLALVPIAMALGQWRRRRR